jgi:hypothetical protein
MQDSVPMTMSGECKIMNRACCKLHYSDVTWLISIMLWFCCCSSSAGMCVFMEETDTFDWSTCSFWMKGWVYLVFKKLQIKGCIVVSLFCQKIDK